MIDQHSRFVQLACAMVTAGCPPAVRQPAIIMSGARHACVCMYHGLTDRGKSSDAVMLVLERSLIVLELAGTWNWPQPRKFVDHHAL